MLRGEPTSHRDPARPPVMTPNGDGPRLRVVSYNILLGGAGRGDRIAGVLGRSGADVIALQECTDLGLIRDIAGRLSMEMVVGESSDGTDLNLAILSRLPVRRWRNHRHPNVMLRGHLECEVGTGVRGFSRVRIHCLHLAARFGERANGETRRMGEIQSVLYDIGRERELPHLITGDLNSIAPGDTVAASAFLARMAELRRAGVVVRGLDGLLGPVDRGGAVSAEVAGRYEKVGIDPDLDVGLPRLPWILTPFTEVLPRLPYTDRFLNTHIQRWTVDHLLKAGYTDCFRELHAAGEPGYTCATWMPAARIDYAFADPLLAPRLLGCAVIGSAPGDDPDTATASDHLPLRTDFRLD
jgi:endonuclease/exonuclease/phosphatase family metal-dependent hydrolase